MSDFEFKKDDCPLVDIEYQRGYLQGKADRDKELAEHNVFCSNIPIEDLVLNAISDERKRVIDEIKIIVSYTAYNRNIQMITMELLWEILEHLKGASNGRIYGSNETETENA